MRSAPQRVKPKTSRKYTLTELPRQRKGTQEENVEGHTTRNFKIILTRIQPEECRLLECGAV
jgi:hypothetical protein